MICTVTMCLAVIVPLSGLANGQTDAESLTVGAIVLRLGFPQSRLQTELGREYDLQVISGSNGRSFMIKDKQESRSSFYASVVFDDRGALATATKHWLPEIRDYKPEDVVLAIYGVIDGFIKQGNCNCVIKTDEHRGPGPVKETEVVMVRCGLKALMIAQSRTSDSVSVGVDEILSKPNNIEPRIVDQ